MPIFEFHCPSCGHDFEELILSQARVSDLTCPKCKESRVEKLLSVFSSGRGPSEVSSSASGAGCGSTGSRFS
jgi:putative FmdB family regulatory protein